MIGSARRGRERKLSEQVNGEDRGRCFPVATTPPARLAESKCAQDVESIAGTHQMRISALPTLPQVTIPAAVLVVAIAVVVRISITIAIAIAIAIAREALAEAPAAKPTAVAEAI